MATSNPRMARPDLLKWDVHPFIIHKKSCLPKCALQKLKDTILEGSHLSATSLKESSGLALENQDDKISMDDGDPNAAAERVEQSSNGCQVEAEKENLLPLTRENGNKLLREDPRTVLTPSKRLRSNLAEEGLVECSHENRIGVDSGDPHVNVKRLKQSAKYGQIRSVEQNSAYLHGNELLEDLSERILPSAEREICGFAKDNLVRGLEESRISMNSGDYIASKGLKQSTDDEVQQNQSDISCDNAKIPQDASRDGTHQNISVNEAKDDSEHCTEPKTSSDALANGSHQNISVDEAKDDNDHCIEPTTLSHAATDGSHQYISVEVSKDESEHCIEPKTSSDAPSDVPHQNISVDEAKIDCEQCIEPETLSDSGGYCDVKIDIAVKKHSFLSSRNIFNHDSLETTEWTEENLCVKCTKGGQLLACNASGCPMVVHDSCLGCSASFDDGGNFYCPFCAYARAIVKFMETKKRVSLARKDLATFAGLFEHQQEKHNIIPREEQSELKAAGDVVLDKIHGNRHLRGIDYNKCMQAVGHHQETQDATERISGDVPFGGTNASLVCVRDDATLMRGEPLTQVNSHETRRLVVQQHTEPLIASINDNLPHGEEGITLISWRPAKKKNGKAISSNYSLRNRRLDKR